ncbi:MAG: hypothetical protein OK449_06700 [Thaumarchaeota archaeon]|nr:hypothetical protein [Nitrososphaerota archaeon]
MRVHSRRGIANGVVLVLVILVVAIPTSTYYFYFSKPITTAPTATETTSSSNGTSTTAETGPALGFVTGSAICGFGLTYGSPGGEGCFVFVLNNGTSTLTAAGTCNLTYGGSTYPGTFSYADQLGPGQSTGKITCGSASEDPPAGAGTKISGQVFFTNGQYVGYNGTAAS